MSEKDLLFPHKLVSFFLFCCAISQKTMTIPPSATLFLGHNWHIHLDILQPNAGATVVANWSVRTATTSPDLINCV